MRQAAAWTVIWYATGLEPRRVNTHGARVTLARNRLRAHQALLKVRMLGGASAKGVQTMAEQVERRQALARLGASAARWLWSPVQAAADAAPPCPECQGTGRDPLDPASPCLGCGGTGRDE